MASLHTGSDELVYIQTDKVSVTIKGPASHPHNQGAEHSEKESFLKVFCDESYEINLKGDAELVSKQVIGTACLGEYRTVPLFYEQQRYEIVIESFGSSPVEFWHENYNVRNKVTSVGRSEKILSGVINFGNEIGMSDLIVQVNGTDYLRLVIEVFPSKISYKNDYKAIVADVTAEVYNVIFDLLKKTYLGYRQNDRVGNSPVEFLAVVSKIYEDFIRAADMILQQPHHELETIHEVLPSHKIKSTDIRTVRWIEKHPAHVARLDNGFAVDKTLAVKKRVNYNTKENRLTKYVLQSTAKKLIGFKRNYMRLQRESDTALISKIDGMIQGITRRCNSGFLANVNAHEASSGMSLVFSMAPGYRELYKYYLMLLRGLSVTGDVFHISVKDLALLYEYWCFIKLNSLMRNSDKYDLISQDIVKIQGNGIYVSLVKGKSSRVRYRNRATQEVITLSYNPKEIDVPTITQKPDNVLTLEKKGTDVQYYDSLPYCIIDAVFSIGVKYTSNPNENHGIGDAFLKAVVQEMVVKDTDGRYDVFQTLLLDFYSFTVYREWKNIDILLVSDQDKFLIAIENKIGAHEHSNQLNRYRTILEADYPEYRKMFIFLTPDGDDPSDVENWDVLSYATIADILSGKANELELQPDIELIIRNYLDVIRRDIVEDQKLIEVCNKIYARHKKALDLIFEYRTDGRSQFADSIRSTLLEMAAEGTIDFSSENSSGSYFTFHTALMNQRLPYLLTPNSSWGTNFVYQYWIFLRDNRMCGVFELGGWNVPEDTMKTMQEMIDLLKPNDKRKENFKYKRIFRTKWYEIKESDHMQEDIAICVHRTVEDLLKQEKELLDKLYALNNG